MIYPNPLTPPDCDLRSMPSMLLDVVRLRDSNIAQERNAEVFRCSVLSWAASWHQIPAASLPDDDTQLAYLLGYGRSVKSFRKVREQGGLRGWIKCSDGRLYHPVVAEKALEAMKNKEKLRQRTEAARQARTAESSKKYPVLTGQPIDLSMYENSVTDNTVINVTASNITEHNITEYKKENPPIVPQVPSVAHAPANELVLQSADQASKPRKTRKAKVGENDPDWQAFYAAYPRKIAPSPGLAAWQRAISEGATPAQIMNALRRFKFSDDDRYIPYPASWLNSGNWKISPITPATHEPYKISTLSGTW